ncbi:hypothetical protein ACFP56_19890 [Paenibacillus septentrionalis]|uniref:Flagellar protein FliT n=1 Tax=Paenibacillus septentrionalis TaxID=429342 RepID=A0ABW1VB85_9BACL
MFDHNVILSSYQALHDLYNKQLELAEQPRYDEQIDDLYTLEESKRELQLTIQEQRMITSDYEMLSSLIKDELMQIIESIHRQNERLQAIIEAWHSEDSRSMKKVNVQRKTLHSYGGLNSHEVISYYIDSKK